MKSVMRFWVFMLLVGAALIGSCALGAEFTPTLDYQLSHANAGEFVSAIVILESPVDIRALDMRLHADRASKARRHSEVLAALKYNAETTQPRFRAELDEAKVRGDLQGYTTYWIENCFVIYAKRDLIESLRSRGDIKHVTENFQAELIKPVSQSPAESRVRNPLDTRTLTDGIEATGVRRVVEELGLTGAGVLVGDNDTGVDGTHPALAARWRGHFAPWWQCWLDNTNSGSMSPVDGNGHGTHTMGTMVGMAINGNDSTWIGCAPHARWIANNAISMSVGQNLNNQILASFQWFTDPDTVNHSADAVPDVINNSWGVGPVVGYVQCFDYWNTAILNCEAGGTVVVFAAGNEGLAGVASLRSPATYAYTETQMFAVGADSVTGHAWPYPITQFSSLGPSNCDPSPDAVKPEVVAPGAVVYSSWTGGTYVYASGTSMACPHVAGVVALMREACPSCDPITIKQALINTARDEGPAGQDNTYGYGFIDAWAAVNAVASMGRVVGTVRDAQNSPLAGVTVSNTDGPQEFLTDANGHYMMPLAAGTYALNYSKFSYTSQMISGIVVVTGDSTVRNVTLQLAPTGTVSGHVTDCRNLPAMGAIVQVVGVPVPPDTTNATGFYSITLPQGLYDMQASKSGCGTATVQGVLVAAGTTQNFTLPPDPRYLCSQPDGGGYIACENGDPGGPAFDWFEISPNAGGAGVPTGITGDDQSLTFPIPFNFTFYGATFNQVNICSNGFLTFNTGATNSYNTRLPVSELGYAILPFWSDFYLPAGGDISTYFDVNQMAFIVEWHAVPYYGGVSPETFQVSLYQATQPNGNSRIRIQYQTVLDAGNCTTGLQDGINCNQYVYNGHLDVNAQGLASGRVITYGGTGCQGSAQITVTPTSVDAFAPVGGTDTLQLHLCNVGQCPMNYDISFVQITPARDFLSHEGRRADNLDAHGGPDTYGNTWIDSNDPGGPTFNWVDITTVGTPSGVSHNDESLNFPLPWPFNFYGTNYSSMWICSNGFMQFGSVPSTAWNNTILPNSAAPHNLIAPFWDDLYPIPGSVVYYYNDTANSRYIVEWYNWGHYGPFTPGVYTYEAILSSNGDITFQYLSMLQTITSATIGIQNDAGTDGLQVACNQVYMANNLAVHITGPHPTAQWLSFGSPTSGSLDSNRCTDIQLRFNAGTLPAGQYTGTLVIVNSDPQHNPLNVPVTFRVGVLETPRNFTIAYIPGTNQLSFRWVSTGAPFYRVFSATTANGPYDNLVGTTGTTLLQIPFPGPSRLYYAVKSWDGTSLMAVPSGYRHAPVAK